MVAELLNVSHRYGSVAALTDVSLSLESGQVTALLGPNGAGKTTAVSLLTGLARPTQGQARLFGGDPQSLAARRRIGVMLQVSKVPETLTVREHLTLFSSYYASPLPLPALLDLAGLAEVADSSPWENRSSSSSKPSGSSKSLQRKSRKLQSGASSWRPRSRLKPFRP
ncbi:MAG: ATP-binding cassette domain-containing protein [Vicinamibacteria bacterium]|nr:ATP-binding cassette domain-containing protein [Vicinamibacteria bacterium]